MIKSLRVAKLMALLAVISTPSLAFGYFDGWFELITGGYGEATYYHCHGPGCFDIYVGPGGQTGTEPSPLEDEVGGTISGVGSWSAYSRLHLGSGTMGVVTDSILADGYYPGSTATAFFGDTLTFHFAPGTSRTITMRIVFDGSYLHGSTVDADVIVGSPLFLENASLHWSEVKLWSEVSLETFTLASPDVFGTAGLGSRLQLEAPNILVGTFDLTDITTLQLSLALRGTGATDVDQTASISLELPPGASFSSASGVLLASATTYVFSGFFAPIDNEVLNEAKAGQTIPIKWQLTDLGGTPIDDPASFKSVTSVGSDCAAPDGTNPIEEYVPSASGLQYLGDGYWQYNWKTPKSYAGSCRTMRLNLADQVGMTSTRTARFQFK